MAHVKPPANAPYPEATTCLQPFAGWRRSVLLATPDANVGRVFARALPFLTPTATTGSAVLATAAMDDIGRNCARVLQPLVGTWLLSSFLKYTRCCDWMA